MRFFAVLLLVLAGCTQTSTVRTIHSGAATTHTTRHVALTNRDMTGGHVTGQRVFIEASASCTGYDCIPEDVELAFVNGSDFLLDIDPREVEITVDGRARTWTNEGLRREAHGLTVAQGEFLRISLPTDDFARMAASRDVSVSFGRTGTRPYVATYERRQPLRDLAEALSVLKR